MKKYLFNLISIALFVGSLTSQSAFAALSASVAFVSNVAQINQPMFANVSISNTGASAVNILSFKPTASATGVVGYSPIPAAFSVYNLGPNASIALPANSTTSIPFQVVFFAPSTGILSNSGGTYSVGALISTSDGSVFAPGAAALATVNALPYPAAQQ